MNYYIELTLIENGNTTLYKTWSKIFTQIHLAFVEQKDSNNQIVYGVSFPEYRFNDQAKIGFLGSKIRIFAPTKEALEALNLNLWLVRLLDYVHIQSIKEVPTNVNQYAIYKRKQMKGVNRVQKDRARFAQSYAKANNISLDEAMELYQNMSVRETHLPFIQMLSLTSDQRFKLFIEKQMISGNSSEKLFTTYGLSAGASVPEF